MSADNYGVIVKRGDEFWVGDWSAAYVDVTPPEELMKQARIFIEGDQEGGLRHLPSATSDEDAEDWIYEHWQVEYGCMFLDLDEEEAAVKDFAPEYHERLSKMTKAMEFALGVTLLGEKSVDDQVQTLVDLGIPRDTMFLLIETMAAFATSQGQPQEEANNLIAGAVFGMISAAAYKGE